VLLPLKPHPEVSCLAYSTYASAGVKKAPLITSSNISQLRINRITDRSVGGWRYFPWSRPAARPRPLSWMSGTWDFPVICFEPWKMMTRMAERGSTEAKSEVHFTAPRTLRYDVKIFNLGHAGNHLGAAPRPTTMSGGVPADNVGPHCAALISLTHDMKEKLSLNGKPMIITNSTKVTSINQPVSQRT